MNNKASMKYLFTLTLLLCITVSSMRSMNSDSDSEHDMSSSSDFDPIAEDVTKVLHAFQDLREQLERIMGINPQPTSDRLISRVIPELQAHLYPIDCSSCSTFEMVATKVARTMNAFNPDNKDKFPELYHAMKTISNHRNRSERNADQLLNELGETMAREMMSSIKTKCTELGISYEQ